MHEDPMTARSLRTIPSTLPALGLAACGVLLASCGGESGPGKGSESILRLNEVGNGFGQLLPHRVAELDSAGNPTGQILSIRSLEDITDNVVRGNPILPSDTFREGAIEPDGQPGNHFLFANFTQPVDPLTVLNPSPTGSPLAGAVSITTINPFNGATLSARGRAFIGGRTIAGEPVGDPPRLDLQRWVEIDPDTGFLRVADGAPPQAAGFPGIGKFVPNAAQLISPNTVLFVADSDNDLTTPEAFPSGVQVRFRVTTALRSTAGEALENAVLASSTVGIDSLPPEVVTTPPPNSSPQISPGNGDTDVAPTTDVRIEFTEPVQPYSVGVIGGQGQPSISSALTIRFGPSTSVTNMPFTALPISPFDLSTYVLTPAFPFPGRGPNILQCGTFFRVDVDLATQQVEDLAQTIPDPNNPTVTSGNLNADAATTFFETGEGPGVVNAPVMPDVIYAGRGGARPGLSVVDLNGYGQSTGNPITTFPSPLEGESRFPFDPNVTLNPAVRPALVPGDCTVDGGSAGVFTLTRDSSLDDLVLSTPLVSSLTDLHAGHALDGTIRNAPPPFGCQASGGYICASDGLKLISAVVGNQPNTVAPALQNQFGALNPGYENIISWAPHPNPPKLTFPPACVSPFLGGEEPTTVDVATTNLLVTGNPFPIPDQGVPPNGLLTIEQNMFFIGPSVGQTQLAGCSNYQIRQQLGHYLYIADRPRNEIVVVNSNRMTVIERIAIPDPTSLAMSPNLDVLAISNQLADTVTFVDINPQSAQFHQIIETVQVGNSPRGLAFEPTNEDVIVCNELSNSISIIGAADLQVRREITSQLNRPFELSVTARMLTFSFVRGVYYGYILNRTGNVALFESGPNGVNGWGFDDVVGIISFEFLAPKTIQLDPINLDGSVYIVHEGPINPVDGRPGNLGDGAISRLRIESALTGQVPLGGNLGGNANFRDLQFSVPLSLGQSGGQLSGLPVDIAFDNQRNLGGLPSTNTNTFAAGSPLPANGKLVYRNGTLNASEPQFLLASVPNPVGGSGVIDVLALGQSGARLFDTDPYVEGVQSIPVPLVTILSDYFRQ